MSVRRRQLRWWFAAILLLLPLSTAWNMVVNAASYPKLAIRIGRGLYGVTERVTPEFSFAAIREGRFQRAVATLVGESLPMRPYLIRLNNQIVFSLFGEVNAPGLLIGGRQQLIETAYLAEYCGRTDNLADTLANRMIPILQDIQHYYKSRGGIFLYVITPSKAAHLPEDFLGRFDCPSTPEARTAMIPRYAARLREAGIALFDAATFTHELKGKYPVEMFPRGGIHWNEIGVARASQEIVSAINQQTGRETLPPFTFDYTVGGPPTGSDRDLADLLNVIVPPLGYPVAKVGYRPSASCDIHPARLIDAAVVGASFMYAPSELLTRSACLTKLNLYFYLRMGRYAGVPQRREKQGLADADLLPLRSAKLLILDENEATVGRSNYVDPFHRMLTQP